MANRDMLTKSHVCIIGAGISGLSAAWEFSNSGFEVDVFEREALPGGLAGWFESAGTTLEKFYHHIYNKDQDIIQLIQELDQRENLVFKSTITGCFYVNRIYRLSSPADLLKYKPLKLLDRFRLGLLALRAKAVKDWKTLDTLTAKEWIIRHAGESVYTILWEPLFRSKFGRYAPDVSAAWLWSKLVQRGGSRGKTGSEELGYFKGGYGLLFKELQTRLGARGVRIHLKSPVQEIGIEDGRATRLKVSGEWVKCDAVLAACQLPDFLEAGSTLPEEYRRELGEIGFLGNTCLVLKLNRRLSETYWVNITDTGCPFVGVIEQTNLLDETHYQGYHFAYLSRYMDIQDPFYGMDARNLFEAYLPYLEKIFPNFEPDWVLEKFLWREPHAQAVVSVGYSRKIPADRTPVPGLYLTTMAQIFPEDRQMSNGIKLARRTARLIAQDLRR
ncbi:NAD(P)/FAD-dependent oxidoreductase [bacterium]|nr:NAD(P)/FAD-dependent oxidoreductase [candidate division CSSED10-310 bacterium]